MGRVVEFLLGLRWVFVRGSVFGSVIWPRIGRVFEFLLGLWWGFVEGSGLGLGSVVWPTGEGGGVTVRELEMAIAN